MRAGLAQARPGKTKWLKSSPTLTFSYKDASSLRVLLENTLSEASTQDSPAAQSSSNHGEHLEETATPVSSAAKTPSASDLELLERLASALATHAYKYSLGSSITVSTDPTAPFDLYESEACLILTYAETHHMWGCKVNGPCHITMERTGIGMTPDAWTFLAFVVMAALFFYFVVAKT